MPHNSGKLIKNLVANLVKFGFNISEINSSIISFPLNLDFALCGITPEMDNFLRCRLYLIVNNEGLSRNPTFHVQTAVAATERARVPSCGRSP